MCNWINVKDRLPQSEEDAEHAVIKNTDVIAPLLLWDAYDDAVGEVHVGFFENGAFGVYEVMVDDSKLHITHWAAIQTPED
jgi:hypothetical protein